MTRNVSSGRRLSAMASEFLGTLEALELLCRELEDFADRLPGGAKPEESLQLARSICPAVKRAHEFEDKVVFAALDPGVSSGEILARTIERLRFEHWEDEDYAEEISESLTRFAENGLNSNVESIGYMLRGFFESKRRHIAFEREHIAPLLSGLKQGD